MSRKSKRLENQQSDVDMTPMLDIVFILLIFFIVTTSFVKEEGLLINKPDANNKSKSDAPVILVKILEAGLVTFNGKAVDVERLPARIESFLAENITTTALLVPHENVTYERVVEVMDQIATFNGLTISIGK